MRVKLTSFAMLVAASALVGGQHYRDRIQSLEQFAETDFEAYVLEATRLDGQLWEVTVNAL